MTRDYEEVRWPARAYKPKGRDLAAPMVALLKQANVLEDPAEVQASRGHLSWKTEPTMQVITSGASSFSKWMSGLVAALGGSAAVLTAISGFWGTSDTTLKVAYVAAMAVLLSVIAIAIAMIVRADLSARAIASAAEYQARADIATAFIQGAVAHSPDEVPAKGSTNGLASGVTEPSPTEAVRRIVITESNGGVPI
jgi:hypothetical protein